MGKIMEAARRSPRLAYYIGLFVAVIAIYVGSNAAMIAVGRDCLWHVDGQPLYMSYLAWEGQQLRAAWDAFISGGPVEVPFFTYSVGYGADAPLIMTAFLNDPLNLLSIFFPVENTITCFTIEIIVRMMLAGVTFSLYCFSRGHGRAQTGVAAVAYICCGYILFWGLLRHPKFINWAILFPLVLQGTDRIFKGKGPVMFILSMAMQFFLSIYYGYMTCFALLAYCLIKYFLTPRNRSVGDFVKLVALFAFSLVVAFCIGGLFSLPQVLTLLSQERATSGAYVPLLHSLVYYIRIPAELVGGDVRIRGYVMGAYILLTMIVFIVYRKRFERNVWLPWFLGLLLCFCGALVPAVGSLFNGRGYPTDRWMLIMGFVAAYIVCLTVPHMPKLEQLDWKRVGIGTAIIAVLAAGYAAVQLMTSNGIQGAIWPLAMTLVFVAGYFIVRALVKRNSSPSYSCLVGVILIIGGVTLTCGFYNTPLGETYGAHFPRYGVTAKELTTDSPAAPIAALDDDGIFRHSYPRVYGGMKNSSLVSGTMAVDYYSSMYNQRVDDFRQELGISDHHLNYSFVGSDSRLAIEKLTGVKYFVISKEDDKWRVPYGFKNANADYGEYEVYETPDPVGLAFAQDAYITHEEYDKLSMVEKSEALLAAAVVNDNANVEGLAHAAVETTAKEVPYEIVKQENLVFDEGVVHVKQKQAKVKLRFKGLAKCETGLCITGLDFAGYDPIKQNEVLGKESGLTTYLKQLAWSDPAGYTVTLESGGRDKRITPVTSKAIGYGGKVDWTMNLGYSEKGFTEATLTFSKPGDYTFKSLAIVCQPIKPVVELSKALADRNLDDLELHTNGLSASMEVADDKPHLAVFTVAYSKGWSATVDGQPAELLNVDTAFMGVKVEGEGRHVIELSYITPGVVEGIYLTVVGLLMLAGIIAFRRVRASRVRAQESPRNAEERA